MWVSGDVDAEQMRDAISELFRRGGDQVYRGALQLAQDARPRARTAGANILAQIGYSDPARYEPDRTETLIALLGDREADVVAAAAAAIGHIPDGDRAISPLLSHVSNRDPQVRQGVAFGLARIDDRRASDALIELSRDADREVRNWATFGLGSISTADYPAVRAALAERLNDEDAEISMEAVAGLAERKDARALTVLRALLAGDVGEVTAGHLDACASLGDPSLLPGLLNLQECMAPNNDAYWIRCLDEAIAACKG